jgi:hypothetical protein
VVTSVTDAGGASTTASAGSSDLERSRTVRIGHSWHVDARIAGESATRDALAVARPRLLVVFASFGYDLPQLLAGVTAAAGEVPVIGCSTAGEIGPGPALRTSVVVVCLAGDFAVATTHASGLHAHARSVGETVARNLLPLPALPHRIALFLTDALAGDQQEMIRGAYGVLGATVPIVGGGAGDDLRMMTSRQFHGAEIMQDAVVAATIGTRGPIGVSLRHGWQRCGDTMVVTASAGNDVHTLDDRPALDVYLDRHCAPDGIADDPAAFAEFGLTRPLAVARRGDVAVRHVFGADPATRSLICAGHVPMGAAAWFATGDTASTLDATDAACADALAQLGGHAPLALLLFNCAGRRALMGDAGVLAERQVIERRAGRAAVGGFYTYGEIARLRGVSGFHNQAVVALTLA